MGNTQRPDLGVVQGTREQIMKVTKKLNHDSIWLKVVDGKQYAKLTINRSGTRVRWTIGFKEVADKIFSLYHQAQKDKLTYGQTLDFVEAKLEGL